MTFRFSMKCDLCGKEKELGWSRNLDDSAWTFEMPEGWNPMEFRKDMTVVKMAVCPDCGEALINGRTVIESYFDSIKPGPLQPYIEPSIINLDRRE